MIPQGFGLLRETFPDNELPKAFGFFGPVMGSAAMIGPILGGALVSAHLFADAWRSVFLINLPIGIVAGVAAARFLPRTSTRYASQLDFVGGALAAIASLALIYPLIQGRALGWPAWSYASIATSIVLFGVFAIHLQRRKHRGTDFVVSAFDTIVAAVTDSELGSASGALNAIQQLGGAVGVAVLGTIFFATLAHHGFAPALQHAMWWAVGALVIVLIASPLLPARARPPEQAAFASPNMPIAGDAASRSGSHRAAGLTTSNHDESCRALPSVSTTDQLQPRRA